ncbi:hypothetical protein PybrP1_002225 [[Pythium] brassicae (nom. inval.)]|nr:hypothetical protein PybrP1_002225 [[Pythium] brassicae (nom. inval.)]
MKLLLAVSAVLAAVASADKAPSTHVRVHVHSTHNHEKFMEVMVVGSREQCPRDAPGLVFCSSLADECGDDTRTPGQRACLPRDGAALLAKIDAKTAGPWNKCSFLDAALPSKCAFGFECLCYDVENKNCKCSPPDAFRIGRGADPSTCTTADGKVGCDTGKYCRTKGGKQECVDAPYLPGLALYAQCGGVYNSPCQDGLTCKQFSTDYSICVKK